MAIHSSSLAWKITSFNKVFSNFVVLDAVSNGSEVKVARSWLTLCDPMDYTVPGILQTRILEWVAIPNPEIKPKSPTLQADSLPAEPPGKPKNIGVGSLSLLQWIFPTQESNQGLLHCRKILYQLSYQGTPLLKTVKLIAQSTAPHRVCQLLRQCP